MRLIRTALLVLTLSLPLSAGAITVAELQTQINSLLQQINTLQQQFGTPASPATVNVVGGTTVTPGSCPSLTRNLSKGMSGADVTALQEYLKRDTSVYPEGQVTGYFGSLTEKAVQAWQAANNIVSSGSPATTGYGVVGPKTRTAIAGVCSGTMPSVTKGQFGATLKASPITGFAPLIVNLLATVNTVGHCEATIYTLDFGDGSSIPIPTAKGVCKEQSVNIPHVYQYAGVYNAKISVGSHETHVVISVSGTPSPTPILNNTAPLATVTMDNNMFSNTTLTVGKGTIVTWKNTSLVPHTVTADDNTFDSGTLQPNLSYSLRFDQPGEYPYYCKFHGVPGGRGGMAGKVIVTDEAAAAGAQNSSNAGAFAYSALTLTPEGMKATAAFNIRGSCDTYSVDWGDDSNALYRFGDGSECAAPQNVQATHTYEEPGTYTVTLSRGPILSNETTGTVTISAPAAQ